jgi:hypothetical protein
MELVELVEPNGGCHAQRMELLEDQNGSNQYLGGSFAFELRAVIIVFGMINSQDKGGEHQIGSGAYSWLSLEE